MLSSSVTRPWLRVPEALAGSDHFNDLAWSPQRLDNSRLREPHFLPALDEPDRGLAHVTWGEAARIALPGKRVAAMTDTEPVAPAQPQPVVIALPDEIDMDNADDVCTQIAAEFAGGIEVVIADMTATRFCDTSGTRAIVLAYRRAAEVGAELRLLMPSPDIMRVWKILGVDAVLPVYHSLDEAVEGVR
jgi:anti-anti-sigma factor